MREIEGARVAATICGPAQAAKVYDEAARLLRGVDTRTNFAPRISPNCPLAVRIDTMKCAGSGFNRDDTMKCAGGATEVYRLDLAPLTTEEFDSWMFKSALDQFPTMDGLPATIDTTVPIRADLPEPRPAAAPGEMAEFERIKVERRISALLYATNGLQEYLDRVFDAFASDSLWDLAPLSH